MQWAAAQTIRHHRHHRQKMIEFLDSVISHPRYDWVDLAALLVVCALALKLRSGVALLILADFALVYFGQNWLRSLSVWGSLGVDYQYTFGIKDTLFALALFLMAASPWLTAAYIIPALLCWGVWSSYSLLEYSQFLEIYYAWSPLYALCMIPQIYGLSRGDSDAGKRIRKSIIRIDWDRILQPVYSVVYARVAVTDFKIERAFR